MNTSRSARYNLSADGYIEQGGLVDGYGVGGAISAAPIVGR